MKPERLQPHAAFLVTSLLALFAAGHMDIAVAQTPSRLPNGDPCSAVSLPDVQKAFPGAKPGERGTRKETYGVTECTWHDGSGVVVFVVQEAYGRDSAMDEAKGLGQAVIEGKTANAGNVRYEILTGVGLGNEAVAFVEARDDKRGIVSEGAMQVLHRGQRTLWLTSPVLPRRVRAAALKALEALGRIAAKRLD